MANPKCKACVEEIRHVTDMSTCSSCKSNFHFLCAGFIEKNFRKQSNDRKLSWKCLKCKDPKSVTDTKRSDTEVLSGDQAVHLLQRNDVSVDTTAANSSRFLELSPDVSDLTNDLSPELAKVVSCIVEKFDKHLISLKEFITIQYTEHSKEIEKTNQLLQQYRDEIKELKETQSKIVAENAVLKSEMRRLHTDLVDLQQYSRRCNVEIHGLPETDGEDMKEVKENIMKVLKLNLGDKVTAIHRIPTTKKDRIRPIIAQFITKEHRDACLKAAKEMRISASAVDSRLADRPVYFNEHLAPYLKTVLYHSKQYKIENDFKFCWIKDGKIFLRKSENSRACRIRHVDDLLNVPRA